VGRVIHTRFHALFLTSNFTASEQKHKRVKRACGKGFLGGMECPGKMLRILRGKGVDNSARAVPALRRQKAKCTYERSECAAQAGWKNEKPNFKNNYRSRQAMISSKVRNKLDL